MDFTKLNPWNWLKKEEEQTGTPPAVQGQGQAGQSHPRTLESLHTDIDRLFDQALRRMGLSSQGIQPVSRSGDTQVFKPKLDIMGSEKEYTITAELPGIEEKNINIEVQGDSLVLKAEKEQEHKSEDKGYYRVERSFGSYQRVLSLPKDADVEGIKANFKNGVVTINVPRTPAMESGGKRIPIE